IPPRSGPPWVLSDTSVKRPVGGILIDFYAFCGYNTIHNHGFGGSKKSRIAGDENHVMKNSFGPVPKQPL
ncbi:MAG: hypothetical protein ACYTEN_12265, partial [Planctomycetota bacterium]